MSMIHLSSKEMRLSDTVLDTSAEHFAFAYWRCGQTLRKAHRTSRRKALRGGGVQERSKLQLLAAGAELVDPELELVWNWNIHVRKHPVRANAEVRPSSQAAALSASSVLAAYSGMPWGTS